MQILIYILCCLYNSGELRPLDFQDWAARILCCCLVIVQILQTDLINCKVIVKYSTAWLSFLISNKIPVIRISFWYSACFLFGSCLASVCSGGIVLKLYSKALFINLDIWGMPAADRSMMTPGFLVWAHRLKTETSIVRKNAWSACKYNSS